MQSQPWGHGRDANYLQTPCCTPRTTPSPRQPSARSAQPSLPPPLTFEQERGCAGLCLPRLRGRGRGRGEGSRGDESCLPQRYAQWDILLLSKHLFMAAAFPQPGFSHTCIHKLVEKLSPPPLSLSHAASASQAGAGGRAWGKRTAPGPVQQRLAMHFAGLKELSLTMPQGGRQVITSLQPGKLRHAKGKRLVRGHQEGTRVSRLLGLCFCQVSSIVLLPPLSPAPVSQAALIEHKPGSGSMPSSTHPAPARSSPPSAAASDT